MTKSFYEVGRQYKVTDRPLEVLTLTGFSITHAIFESTSGVCIHYPKHSQYKWMYKLWKSKPIGDGTCLENS